jgi:hypothetical protein
MGKIEQRVLGAALLGALAMLGVVGFTRHEPAPVPAQRAVPVAVDSHDRVTSSAETAVWQAKFELTRSAPNPGGGVRRS